MVVYLLFFHKLQKKQTMSSPVHQSTTVWPNPFFFFCNKRTTALPKCKLLIINKAAAMENFEKIEISWTVVNTIIHLPFLA